MKKLITIFFILSATINFASAKEKDFEPVVLTGSVCCKDVKMPPFNMFVGCRVTKRVCGRKEPIWGKGAVVCSPVMKECLDGRCCQFRTKR